MLRWIYKFPLRLRSIFRKDRVEQELSEELRFHLESLVQENLAKGMTPDEARYAAYREFGGVEQLKEECRDNWGVRLITELGQDLRYGLRQLRRNPGFTAVAVLTLALGIGATTAIFTLINALVFQNLPLRRPERLVELYAARQGHKAPLSYPMYSELVHGQRVFSDLAGWACPMSNIEINGIPSLAGLCTVTGNYYSTLGVSALLGHLITPQEGEQTSGGGSQVVVISYDFWQRRFGGATDVLGKQIAIDGHPFTIVGITRKWFSGMMPGTPPDVTVPIAAGVEHPGLEDRSHLWVQVTGRLKPGVTVAQAKAQLRSFWPAVLQATTPTEKPGRRRQTFLSMDIDAVPAAAGVAPVLRSRFVQPLYVLLGIVSLILLAACVNVANLMLARSAARGHEMSVRLALGANRRALLFQVLTESLLLSISGGLLGLVLAWWGTHLLVAEMSEGLLSPIVLNLNPDLHVLLLTAAATLATGVLFGLAPAWRCSREAPESLLRQSSPAVAGGPGKLGNAFTIAQVALSLALLMGASLLLQSFRNLASVHFGFNPQRVLEFELFPRPGGYQKLDMNQYHEQLMGEIARLPGVASAAISNVRLPGPVAWQDTVSAVPAASAEESGVTASLAIVSPGFFRTFGIGLVRGRGFDWSDDQANQRLAIINEALARRLFPSGTALGQRVRFGALPYFRNLEVVGVANNSRVFDLRDASEPVIYVCALQFAGFTKGGNLYVGTKTDSAVLARTVKSKIESLGHEYPISVKTIAQAVSQLLVEQRVVAILSSFFGALALLLASIGLYGVMSQGVARRTHEIGIRMALGAGKSDVLAMIERQGLKLTLIGVALGIAAALGLTRFLSSLLYGVKPTDPLMFVAVSLILIAVAMLACYIPARRAAKIDPMVALRYE